MWDGEEGGEGEDGEEGIGEGEGEGDGMRTEFKEVEARCLPNGSRQVRVVINEGGECGDDE